jgi:hypothetical protein
LTHAAQVTRHQHDVGALDGDIGAGADGDTDIGFGERRRIVDAVADKRHLAAPLPSATGSPPPCPSGSTSATTSSIPRRAATASAVRRLSPVIIATVQAERMQRRDRLGRSLLDRIGDGDDRREPAVDRGIERRLAFIPERGGGFGECRHLDARPAPSPDRRRSGPSDRRRVR